MTDSDNSRFHRDIYRIGPQGAESLQQIDLRTLPGHDELIWIHLAGDIEGINDWLDQHSNIDHSIIDVLCLEHTRPRLFIDNERNVILTLRTAIEVETETTDLMSLRIWASKQLIVSVSRHPTNILTAFIDDCQRRNKLSGNFQLLLLELCYFITEAFTEATNLVDDQVIQLEDDWEADNDIDFDVLTVARQKISRISRHLLPQLEALQKLDQHIDELDLPKTTKQKIHSDWREINNMIKRDLEALSDMRERLSILKDTLQQESSERINRTMYLLSLVATFFLPLTFLTGLLGMNVAGIPAANSPVGFWLVCLLMVTIAILQWLLFKRWQWLK